MRVLIVVGLLLLNVPLFSNDDEEAELKQQIETLKEKIKGMRKDITEKEKRIAELESKIKKFKAMLEKERPKPPPTTTEVVAEGRIFLFNREKKMVVVTLGSAHNLKEGDILRLYRKDKEIGKLRVCVVLGTDSANAEIVEEGGGVVVEPAVGDVVRLIRHQRVETLPERPEHPLTRDDVTGVLRRITDSLIKLNKRIDEIAEILSNVAKRVEALAKTLDTFKEKGYREYVSKKASNGKETRKGAKKESVAYVFSVISDDKVFLYIGEKNDVGIGDVFVIYRNTEQIAKVVIVNIYKDLARALVLDRKEGVRIRDRDLAVRVEKGKKSPKSP